MKALMAALVLAFCAPLAAQSDLPTETPAPYTAVHEYNPSRNPSDDLLAARAEAKRTGRHILLEVGGKWCIWCKFMEKFFEANPDAAKLRDDNYITLYINMSPENQNKEFLSRFPKIAGYPHLFVVDADGNVLQSQDTSELEDGRTYNHGRMLKFLKKYAPKNKA